MEKLLAAILFISNLIGDLIVTCDEYGMGASDSEVNNLVVANGDIESLLAVLRERSVGMLV